MSEFDPSSISNDVRERGEDKGDVGREERSWTGVFGEPGPKIQSDTRDSLIES